MRPVLLMRPPDQKPQEEPVGLRMGMGMGVGMGMRVSLGNCMLCRWQEGQRPMPLPRLEIPNAEKASYPPYWQ